MSIFLIIIMSICLVGLLWRIAGMIQIHKFYNYMIICIDNAYENHVNENVVAWPDVHASFANLKWYNVWDYRFSKMIVFKKV